MKQAGFHGINYALEQAARNRELIGDHYTPVDELVRPHHSKVKKYLWERRVARIKKHEERAAMLLREGLIKYMNQNRD